MRTYLIAAVIAFGCVQNAFATADGTDHYRVVRVQPGDMLNIRAKPSAQAAIVGKIPAAAQGIENLGERWPPYYADIAPEEGDLKGFTKEERKALLTGNTWLKIRYKNMAGWVRSKFLAE